MQLFGLPPTLTKYEIPPNEIRNEYQTVGYRPPHQPWTNYLLSVFQANNQSINVWTHFIPFLLIVYRVAGLSESYDLISDPYIRPLGAGILGFEALFLVSSVAHCFCDRSELVHFTCFFMDYGGVGIFSIGGTLITHNYFVEDETLASFLDVFSVPVGTILAVSVCWVCCFTKVTYGKRNLIAAEGLKVASVGVSYLWLQVPIIYQTIAHHQNASQHIYHTMWIVLACLLYMLRAPERWFPAKFDIIGNSHQIFHLCLYFSVEQVLQPTLHLLRHSNIEERYRNRALPTLSYTYGCVLVVIMLDAVVVAVYYNRVKEYLKGKRHCAHVN